MAGFVNAVIGCDATGIAVTAPPIVSGKLKTSTRWECILSPPPTVSHSEPRGQLGMPAAPSVDFGRPLPKVPASMPTSLC
jgi:hypothetical protein